MRTFRLDKLVLDGVYENMLAIGQQPEHRVLTEEEFGQYMPSKITEEAAEYVASGEVKELSDLLQVIDDEAVRKGSSIEEVFSMYRAKKAKMGGFSGRHFVSTLALNDNDPWVEYYAAHPERFPEITDKGKSV